jgi:hypothetical protein
LWNGGFKRKPYPKGSRAVRGVLQV